MRRDVKSRILRNIQSSEDHCCSYLSCASLFNGHRKFASFTIFFISLWNFRALSEVENLLRQMILPNCFILSSETSCFLHEQFLFFTIGDRCTLGIHSTHQLGTQSQHNQRSHVGLKWSNNACRLQVIRICKFFFKKNENWGSERLFKYTYIILNL